MKRLVIFFFGIVVVSATTTLAIAQSGSTNIPSSGGGGGSSSVSSGSSLGSSATDGASSSSGSVGSRFLEADILNGRSQVIRSSGQANYLNSLGVKEYEMARRIYIENQILIAEQRQLARDRKERKKAKDRIERKTRYAMQRRERQLQKSLETAHASMIAWPEALSKSKYDKYRTEIEELAVLYAKLDEKRGVELGLKASVRALAKRIVKDEQAGLISDETSKEVRSFVIALNRNHGQFPSVMSRMKGKGAEKMMASNM